MQTGKMAGPTTDTSLGPVIDILKYMPETVRFTILRLGKDCNADDSNSLIDAKCSVSVIRDERKVMMVRNFNTVFKRGIELMNELKSGDMNSFKNMEKHYKAAIIVLAQFLEEKGMTSWFYIIAYFLPIHTCEYIHCICKYQTVYM